MATILIAGSGYVGTALGSLLTERGHEVWGLRRDASALPAPIRPVSLDLLDENLERALPGGVEYLFYTAAPEESQDEAYRATFVTGLGNLLAALDRARAPLRRVLFTSSTAVYGQNDGAWIDERSPTLPEHFTGRRLLEAEELLQKRSLTSICVRFAGIYGPGRTTLLRGLLALSMGSDANEQVFTNRISPGRLRRPARASHARAIARARLHRRGRRARDSENHGRVGTPTRCEPARAHDEERPARALALAFCSKRRRDERGGSGAPARRQQALQQCARACDGLPISLSDVPRGLCRPTP